MIELLNKIHDIYMQSKRADEYEKRVDQLVEENDKLKTKIETYSRIIHNLQSYNLIDCHKCYDRVGIAPRHMILCNKCGNKRCPRASDHSLECTNSNEPGQPGSIYKKFEATTKNEK